MAIMIHEYLDGNGGIGAAMTEVANYTQGISVTEGAAENNIAPDSLMVDIEAIHAMPHATRNYTRYSEKCLKNSVPGWTQPYPRPLIKHHNEKDGDIIGRVISAEYKTRDTFSNTPALLLTVNVPGEQAKADVKNGLNRTVSIGVIAEDVRCSICGKQIELDDDGNVISCEHQRGHVYGKETAYWDIHSMEPKEVSYVVVPSDMFAGNVRSYPATKAAPPRVTESLDDDIVAGTIDNTSKGESDNMDIKEMEAKVQAAEKKATDLEAGLKAMTESKGALDAKVKELTDAAAESTKKIEAAEKANADLTAKIEALEAAKAELETKVKDMTEAAKAQEEKMAEEVKMKEGLESELSSTKVSLKESLIDNLQSLRKLTGKSELDADKLKNREESSIRDSINDLKLEMAESVAGKEEKELPAPGSVKNPAMTEEAKESTPAGTSVKESADNSNVDLKAGLENIFMAVARAHR